MKKFLIGKKEGMTQLILEDGRVVPVTVVIVEPCVVLSQKTKEKDGYNAVVVGAESISETKLNKPAQGYLKALGAEPVKHIKEFRVDNPESFEPKSALTVEVFEQGEIVKVKGKSSGKGFQGTIKRHHFARGPMSHGSKNHRLPGSIGAGTGISHVFKGLRMSGHMGDSWVTQEGLEVVRVDKDRNLLFIKGAVPGKRNNRLYITN